jgi:ubiquinone biosynthesis monooxygenase Coq7
MDYFIFIHGLLYGYCCLYIVELDNMIDKIIVEFDKIVRNLFLPAISSRIHPDAHIAESKLNAKEKKHVIGLMRVNHCGEICAQALYQGQALISKDQNIKKSFEQAAFEETEHLVWTAKRIKDLGGKVSYLTPVFYLGSLSIGILAGCFGEKWNLGFLVATEQQVARHLNQHLAKLPNIDLKSKAILEQMCQDELKHASMAEGAGAANLPAPIKGIMKLAAKVMTVTTYSL